MLEGFHLSPSTFPCCLYDTRLETTDILVCFLPVHDVPVYRFAQGCTSCIRCHLLFLSGRFAKLSRNGRPCGSLPIFMGDDVAGFAGSIPIHPVTGWHSLSPHSFARYPLDAPCGFLPLSRRITGLPCFSYGTRQVRFALFAGSVSPMSGDSVTPELATCLLAQAQSLWLVLN